MRSRLVVVAEALVDGRFKVTPGQDEQVLEALGVDGPHEPIGEGVGPRWQQHRIPKVIGEPSW
ncbi:MAG: hypothetical protein ACYCS4_10165 [Acidimicrobiales bacterium]